MDHDQLMGWLRAACWGAVIGLAIGLPVFIYVSLAAAAGL